MLTLYGAHIFPIMGFADILYQMMDSEIIQFQILLTTIHKEYFCYQCQGIMSYA